MKDRINTIKSLLAQPAFFHVVVFFLWLHVLVFLKWDSDVGFPNNAVLNPWYESQEYHDRYDQLVRMNEEHEKAIVKMQSLQNRFNAVSKSIEKILLEHEGHPLSRQEISANDNLDQLLFAQATDASFHSPNKLRQLLENEHLEDAYPLENSLRPAFREATADLQQNMELGMGNSMDWKGLQSEFKSINIPERPILEVLPSSCESMASRETEDGESPTEEELNQRIQVVRELAAERWKVIQDEGHDSLQLPFSFEETVQRQQLKKDEMLNELEVSRLEIAKERGAIKIDEESDATTTGQCIKSQDVLPWINDGLDAYFRRRDPRQAILRKVMEAYPMVDASEALIELPSPLDESGSSQAAPANLRQLLDGPLIMESARGINAIIDLMGGYSDVFDQYIDGLGVDDVGKAVIQTLMKRAGNVKLPPMLRDLDVYRKKFSCSLE